MQIHSIDRFIPFRPEIPQNLKKMNVEKENVMSMVDQKQPIVFGTTDLSIFHVQKTAP